MSLFGRVTEDYSPLKPHAVDRKDRQNYESAVNARREMLEVLATQPTPKFSKKQYERLRRQNISVERFKGEQKETFRKRKETSYCQSRRILKSMLRPHKQVQHESN